MGNIVLLDELTINKIAAGEVIERPANVVKELVENSIDAGANKIIVEIKKGGKTYIKVTDNGKGMLKDDMAISLERHATSKLKNIDDLENIYTMGFRGEALASISAISKLTMQSKAENELIGIKLEAKAGEIYNMEEVAMQTGTTILVENLFYNTPVRYKFLKQDSTEFKYIKEWIEKTALVNTEISFKLINEQKEVFSSSGNGKIEDIIYKLYGKEIQENLVKVNFEESGIKVEGVIGNTLIAKDSRKCQIAYLNKRNIRNNILTSSADQAFKGATGIGKYGFFILNVSMPANYYDVNVHPTKMEVRFKDESQIYRIFYHAIKGAMLKSEFLGNKDNEENNQEYIKNEYNFLTNKLENVENTNKKSIEGDEPELRKRENARKIDYKYIGILFKTYIVVQIDDEIYLIDQHAAHERVLYEGIKENYKNRISQNTQMMLIPEVFNLTHKEMEFINQNIEIIKNIGFEVEPFGENTIKVTGIPDLEYRAKTQNIFLDILDEIVTDERTKIKDVEERFIATVACKAAVKANMDLKKEEVDSLIQNLLNLNNPYTCPHGRPTTIKLSKSQFEKDLKNNFLNIRRLIK